MALLIKSPIGSIYGQLPVSFPVDIGKSAIYLVINTLSNLVPIYCKKRSYSKAN